ncbi:hypothetical protein BLNAU_4248 [Blattamonas nauphoetae]|uniref:Uncharacterized protein n=1 Tax=Blattamonas nauphoetae TaxID=2049346 RepID=A0ABQ9YAP3_9EUKA|nr:hypothetical protein BLNAU_4248 [Blattamonas nauphoetae]
MSLFCIIALLGAETVDLQTLVNDCPAGSCTIKLEKKYYTANKINVNNLNLIIEASEECYLDLSKQTNPAFVLAGSTLKITKVTINLSPTAVLVDARNDSKVELENCSFLGRTLSKALVYGAKSSLTLTSMTLSGRILKSSLIEADPAVDDPDLSITLDKCDFLSLEAATSKPIVSGERILKTTFLNSSFSSIKCTDTGPLPATTDNIPGREVRVVNSNITYCKGPLSGLLTFGVQASKLYMANVFYINNANSVRFSDCVSFTPNSVVEILYVTAKGSFTTDLWPSGGFLYLPYTTTTLTINNTRFDDNPATEHGGSIYIATEKTVALNTIIASSCVAGKDGGFLYFAGHGTLDFYCVNMTANRAKQNGGSLFLADYDKLNVYAGAMINCSAGENGGAVALTLQKGASTTFNIVAFVNNEATGGLGKDVLATKGEKGKKLSKSAFVKCTSSTNNPKVTLMPEQAHFDWSNNLATTLKNWIIFIVVVVIVVIVLSIVLPCICCCCGCCAACVGAHKENKMKYSHVESQPNYGTGYSGAGSSGTGYPGAGSSGTGYPGAGYSSTVQTSTYKD